MNGREGREWLPAVLCLAVPCLTAAVTVAGTVTIPFLPKGSPWAVVAPRAVVVTNLALAGVGAAAGGLLLSGPTPERVGRSVACGLGGLLLHFVALLPCAGVAYLLSS